MYLSVRHFKSDDKLDFIAFCYMISVCIILRGATRQCCEALKITQATYLDESQRYKPLDTTHLTLLSFVGNTQFFGGLGHHLLETNGGLLGLIIGFGSIDDAGP